MSAYLRLVTLVIMAASAAFAAGLDFADPEAVGRFMNSLDATPTAEPPLVYGSDDGYVRGAIAPPGGVFRTESPTTKSDDPVNIARQFLLEQYGAFGAKSNAIDFQLDRLKSDDGRRYVRMQQLYRQIPVYGAQANVQLDEEGGIEAVLSDLLRDVEPLDTGKVPTQVQVTSGEAADIALGHVANEYPGASLTLDGEPKLKIYAPAVLGVEGALQLVWHMMVASEEDHAIAETVLVNARTGAVALSFSAICGATAQRVVYDGDNSADLELARGEGQPVTGVSDVDDVYEFSGLTRQFYHEQHGRDGYDGEGSPLVSQVRFCQPFMGCPMLNAFWSPVDEIMGYGQGMGSIDIVAHEFTHGVTQYESNLIYFAEPGAINEVFSDSWGEFVELTYPQSENDEHLYTMAEGGTRWLVAHATALGAIRNMADPPSIDGINGMPMPDYYNSPNFYEGPQDNSGVHHNSGIGNKLVYLLTDGDSFRGRDIFGMGIERTAALLYEAQSNLLTRAAQYRDFHIALMLAARNLGFSNDEINNVQRASEAVEIASPILVAPLGQLRAIAGDATSDVMLRWSNPTDPAFERVVVQRSTQGFPGDHEDGVRVYEGTGSQHRDTGTSAGTEYFYGVFAQIDGSFVQEDFQRVVAGADETSGYLTEVFSPNNPFDLDYSQLMFSPAGDPADAIATGQPQHYVNYSNYNVTFTPDVFSLPVNPRSGIRVYLKENGFINLHNLLDAPDFPFFGNLFNDLVLAANGYITTAQAMYVSEQIYAGNEMYTDPIRSVPGLSMDSFENFPSMASHFAIPRISFLFSDLSPATQGEVWARRLDDRMVVSFNRVDEAGGGYPPTPNTVQVELFFSGHIRMTYQEVNVRDAVAGLSDGRGAPGYFDGAGEFRMADGATGEGLIDFSGTPPPGPVQLDPIPVQVYEAGQTVEFSVSAGALDGVPSLSASRVPGGASFTDNEDGTGSFVWPTNSADAGVRSVEICAALGDDSVCQDVLILVFTDDMSPVVGNLRMSPSPPKAGRPMRAQYDFADPQGFGEHGSMIAWYRNSEFVPHLFNQRYVPAEALRQGDRWLFAVVPRNVIGLTGRTVTSRAATVSPRDVDDNDNDNGPNPDVNRDGRVDAIDLQIVINAILGLSVPDGAEPDVNRDGQVNALDLQIVINTILGN